MEISTIIVAIIAVGVPAFTTLITSSQNKKQNELNNMITNILVLIMQDHLNVIEGKIPLNYITVHDIYDVYVGMDGFSYIHEVVNDYDDWINERRKNEK